jgi:hypothetical protein
VGNVVIASARAFVAPVKIKITKIKKKLISTQGNRRPLKQQIRKQIIEADNKQKSNNLNVKIIPHQRRGLISEYRSPPSL